MLIGLRSLASLVLVPATALPIVVATLTPDLDRLADMPPSTRLELAEALDRFDRLPSDEQRAIRELDEALDRLDPEERRRHLDLMRRFGAWFRGLDEEVRRDLMAAPIDQRFAMIRDRLAREGSPDSPGLDMALWFRSETFNPVPLYDAAALLRVWAKLDDRGRRQVEAARSSDEAISTLRRLGREREIEPPREAREVFRAIFEEQGRFGQRNSRLFPDVPDVETWLLDPFGGPEGRPPSPPGNFQRPRGGPPQPPESMRMAASARMTTARLSLLRVLELDYLRSLDDRPEVSPPADLASFEARLPDWYRAILDPLPPEIVRARLRGLRRLALSDPDIEAWLSSVPLVAPPGPNARPGASEGRSSPGTPF